MTHPASATGDRELVVEGLEKRYGDSLAVEGASFTVRKGELVSLLGPSGCGKTTTLRMIAGFVVPDAGRIWFRGRNISALPPYRRDVGLVFQSYALFPHMTVRENVGFGVRMQKKPRATVEERTRWALDLVRLGEYGDRKPSQLSGGQQQRVAVARVLAAGASFLLLDEPFSNLDARLRRTMQVELRELQQRLGISAIHVTHDQDEALTMSDRVIVMDRGRIEQDDAPERVYRQPATAFVAEFMGDCNRVEVRVLGRAPRGEHWEVELAGGQRLNVSGPVAGGAGPRAIAFIRPEHVVLLKQGATSAAGSILRGRTRHRVFLGPYTRLDVELDGGQPLRVHSPNPAEGHLTIEPGDPVELRISPEAVRLLPATPPEQDLTQET